MVFGKKKEPENVDSKVQEVKSDSDKDEFSVSYTKEQLMAKIERLQQSENIDLYLKTLKGKDEYDELIMLMDLIEN